jgi:hypothetical protein
MNHNEACEALGLNAEKVKQDGVNPLRVAINHFFFKPTPSFVKDGEIRDYRKQSVDLCVDKKVDFGSEYNTTFDISKRYVSVKCPSCGNMLNGKGGGGSGSNYSIDYPCTCGVMVVLSVPAEGFFSVTFPPKK